MWTDGTSTDFFNWAPGEPNDQDGTENCAEMFVDNWASGMWNDERCEALKPYVCKAPKG